MCIEVNILIRIPNKLPNELETSLAEYEETAKDQDYLHYFRVSVLPKNANPGDRAYILIDGKIIGYHVIAELRNVTQTEAQELSHGDWQEGYYIIRRADSWKTINPPIKYEKTKGQWTWRYFK